MDPNPYQTSAQQMIFVLIVFFTIITALLCIFSVLFFLKYSKEKEMERQFAFLSDMSHEMRTPLNGILGMAALSKKETDVSVLHHNFEQVEKSGQHLLRLVNRTLNYKNEKNPTLKTKPKDNQTDFEWSALSGKKILLCEDNHINAEITRRMLEKVHCIVEVAQDGRQGLDMFSAAPVWYYDAILMDIRMPVMDGNESAKSIRALNREDAKKIPILAITANSFEEDKEKTKAAGMNAHLTKPVNPNFLYKTLSLSLCSHGLSGKENRK